MPRVPEYAHRNTRGDEGAVDAATSPSGSVYPPKPPHAASTVAPDHIPFGEKTRRAFLGPLLVVPVLAIPLGALYLIGSLVRARARRQGRLDGWSTAREPSPVSPAHASPVEVRWSLERIAAVDPGFSALVLEDFLATLYVEAHAARGTPALGHYTPYLRPAALAALEALGHARVSPIVVGAMRPVDFEADDSTRQHWLTIALEANLTETPPGGGAVAFYVLERWTLAPVYGTRSRPPTKARALTCPACGAPLDRTTRGSCGYCRQAVDSGTFDWVVERIEELEREPRPPMLTGTTEEQGTARPTVFDPALPRALEQASAARVSLEGLEPRTRAIFDAMQRSWSSRAWDGARQYLSDRLWSAQTYWIAAYRSQGLRNVTENATIRRFELYRLGRDAHCLAATVRIHAESLDYTLRDSDGAVVGGSRTKPRPYTEYWTLLRSVAEPRPDGFGCPACGAPLGHAMTMRCGHCGALVEASTFDWVLSRIEQDEVYVG